MDRDVLLINRNLDVTLSLVTAIKGDTGNILGQAGGANDTAACISRKLFGPAGDYEDCQGQATPAASQGNRGIVAPGRLSLPSDTELSPDQTTPPPPADPGAPVPAPEQGQPLPLPLPELPKPPRPLGDVIDRLLPGLGQDGIRPGGQPPGDLLERLLPGLGLR